MCSSIPPKQFPGSQPSRGDTTLPASVYASTQAPALTDASTGKPLKPPSQLPAVPGLGTGMRNDHQSANPFLSMLARMGMS